MNSSHHDVMYQSASLHMCGKSNNSVVSIAAAAQKERLTISVKSCSTCTPLSTRAVRQFVHWSICVTDVYQAAGIRVECSVH